jgi:hypothetical protein
LIPENKEKDKKFHSKYDEKVGHPMDLFVYLKMANKIEKKIVKK